MSEAIIANLRSRLNNEPSVEEWQALLKLLENITDPGAQRVAIEYTEEHLHHWQDKWRNLSPKHQLFGGAAQETRLLVGFPLLRSLSISSNDPAYLIEHRDAFAHITSITASWSLEPENLDWVSHFPAITHFDIRTDGLESIAGLTSLPLLHKLRISGYNYIKDYNILPQLPQLRELSLNDIDVPGLDELKLQLPHLESLTTTNHQEELSWIDISSLQGLKEYECKIEDLAYYVENDTEDGDEEGALDAYWKNHLNVVQQTPCSTFWVCLDEKEDQDRWLEKAPPTASVHFYESGEFDERQLLRTHSPPDLRVD